MLPTQEFPGAQNTIINPSSFSNSVDTGPELAKTNSLTSGNDKTHAAQAEADQDADVSKAKESLVNIHESKAVEQGLSEAAGASNLQTSDGLPFKSAKTGTCCLCNHGVYAFSASGKCSFCKNGTKAKLKVVDRKGLPKKRDAQGKLKVQCSKRAELLAESSRTEDFCCCAIEGNTAYSGKCHLYPFDFLWFTRSDEGFYVSMDGCPGKDGKDAYSDENWVRKPSDRIWKPNPGWSAGMEENHRAVCYVMMEHFGEPSGDEFNRLWYTTAKRTGEINVIA